MADGGACVLIDYGSGNLRSAQMALAAAGVEAKIVVSAEPEVVAAAERLVLPGVGAFAACMEALRARDGLVEAMTAAVRRGAPFLGVCVGMQLLADQGLEFGTHPGLGWIGGEVVRLAPSDPALKVPHVGWNSLDWNSLEDVTAHPLLAGQPAGAHMYFTHSYRFAAADEADVIAWTEHGGRFPAAVARGNVAGVQFHPEKSQAAGLTLWADFLRWRP